MKAFSKNVRISPKKAVLIAGMVKQMNAKAALTQLQFTPKKGAKVLYKILTSAVANAKNNFQQDENKLIIKTIRVTKGVTYKRGLPISKGRSQPIHKRNSNIYIEVGLSTQLSEESTDKPTTSKEVQKKTVAKKKDEQANPESTKTQNKAKKEKIQ